MYKLIKSEINKRRASIGYKLGKEYIWRTLWSQ